MSEYLPVFGYEVKIGGHPTGEKVVVLTIHLGQENAVNYRLSAKMALELGHKLVRELDGSTN